MNFHRHTLRLAELVEYFTTPAHVGHRALTFSCYSGKGNGMLPKSF